jgi:ribosomal protein S18 acetylase RimI-like enzyme
MVMRCDIATAADAAPLADLVNAAYRGTGGHYGWTHEGELLAGERAGAQDISALIGSHSTTVLVCRGDKPPALSGCVAIEMTRPDRCTISMLAVAPAFQAGGLGRALLAAAEAFATLRGSRVAKMTVVQQRESLIAWYERRGFRRTGAHEAFPYGDASVGTPLRDDLRFVVLEKPL